ncbi:MAG TPA: glycosyltransferase [Pilimelia sp.]|nr:glycosyltransferase [Pilimelia sp.]
MKRILYLGFFLPPSRASGVYRTRATANHLAARGWEVTALAAPLRFLRDIVASVDESLVATVDPRVRVERPDMSYYPWETDIRRFSRLRQAFPTIATKVNRQRSRRGFPEAYASWGWRAARTGLRLHRRRRFDAILATGNPFVALAAAWLVNRLTGVPYIVDYRDSWTLNLFTDEPAHPPGHASWRWERRILSQASGIVFVNEALREWHAARYPAFADKMMVVPNGWDPDLLDLSAAEEQAARERAAAPDRPLQYGFLGTVTHNQPVDEMVAAFRLARAHPSLAGAQLNIHGHLGFYPHNAGPLKDRLGIPRAAEESDDGAVRYRGPVAKTAVASVYTSSDVLVFLAGGARYVTSGKIFEYMASGRPIVSVHAPGIAAQEVLSGYPLWFHADSLEPAAVAEAMVAAGAAARAADPALRAAAQRWAASFAREKLLTPLVDRLEALAARPGRAAGAVAVTGARQPACEEG